LIGLDWNRQSGFADAMTAADPTKACNQDDATGFIRLNGLRLKVAAKVHGKKK
jgi:argininosuccinate synthase